MLELTLVGGPTAMLEYGGLRWLTDPTASPPGEYAGGLVKITGPALTIEQSARSTPYCSRMTSTPTTSIPRDGSGSRPLVGC
jgi:hypothetical protein